MNEETISYAQVESNGPPEDPPNYGKPKLKPGALEKIPFRENPLDLFSFELEALVPKNVKPGRMAKNAYVLDNLYSRKPYSRGDDMNDYLSIVGISFRVQWDEETSCYVRMQPNELVTIKTTKNIRSESFLTEIAAMQHLESHRNDHYYPPHQNQATSSISISSIISSKEYVTRYIEALYDENAKRIYTVTPRYESVVASHLSEVFDESHARHIFFHILSGLRVLARAGIYHSAISLENIKRAVDGSYVLEGFGTSKRIPRVVKEQEQKEEQKEQEGGKSKDDSMNLKRRGRKLMNCHVQHVSPYSPPETIFSQPYRPSVIDGPSVDLWAASVALFAMLTGFLPGDGTTETPTIGYLAGANPEFLQKELLSQVPSDSVRHLLQWVFQDDPGKRPSLHDVLNHGWIAGARILHSELVVDPIPYHEVTSSSATTATATTTATTAAATAATAETTAALAVPEPLLSSNSMEEDVVQLLRSFHQEDSTVSELSNFIEEGADLASPLEIDAADLASPLKESHVGPPMNNDNEPAVEQHIIRKGDVRSEDVLFGRGGKTNVHPGNKYWRGVCDEFLSVYVTTIKSEKRAVAVKVLDEISRKRPQALFLMPAEDGWKKATEEERIRRTMQRLREKAIACRKKLGGSFEGTGIKNVKKTKRKASPDGNGEDDVMQQEN